MSVENPRRRRVLGMAAMAALPLHAGGADAVVTRAIPRSGERLPVVGMGTWLTFDIGRSAFDLARRRQVLLAFYAGGGRVIDSSPMYGRAEAVVGELLPLLPDTHRIFTATKVWTTGRDAGARQMQDSLRLWGRGRFDLMQIHNMVDWELHLQTLKEWKAQGRIRYIGITTSHGRRHEALEVAMRREEFDFIQVTYSLADRSVERRLLPHAAERGMAVIANRPFDGGALVDRLIGFPLPSWAARIGCENWAQVCLKWIVSHPAITCAIPATTNPDHARENVGALRGPLPDADLRRTIADHVARL
jgi:diketogulonate reductase-like aldo/keto reductase